MAEPVWMIYGANGYTGRRIAETAVRRGLKPILAGRDPQKIAALAGTLECPSRTFVVADRAGLVRGLSGVKVVLNCAGPFAATAAPMIEGCLESRTHYLDITGEIPAIEAAASRHQRALQMGVVLLPAVGFDVVPSDCLAAKLAARLPGATWLQLAVSGTGQVSEGTMRTILQSLPQGGRARINGRITKVPLLWRTMEIPFRRGPRFAVSAPWGDVASAWYSTGIPNIEVYMAVSQKPIPALGMLRTLEPLLRLPWPKAWLRPAVRRMMRPPGGKPGQAAHASFWGRVCDAQGKSVAATLETGEAYDLTVVTALACVGRVICDPLGPGFWTPSKAFGGDFVLSIPGTDFQWL